MIKDFAKAIHQVKPSRIWGTYLQDPVVNETAPRQSMLVGYWHKAEHFGDEKFAAALWAGPRSGSHFSLELVDGTRP
jgi:hypothetical protein